MRTWLIFTGTLLWVLTAAVSARAFDAEGLAELNEKNECADITMAYPNFGIPKFDGSVSAWAEDYFKAAVEDYKQYCLEDPEFREKSADWHLTVTAREIKSTPGTVSIYFYLYGYAGGARPSQGAETLLLDMEGKRLGYDDLFGTTEGLWDFLAKRANADLSRQAKQAGVFPAPTPLTVAPKADSFKRIMVTPDGLTLIFPAEQAADDSDSEKRCNVPLAALAGFNPKPGIWEGSNAVKPAFDCAKPANKVEAEICVNPILVLYEEEMGQEYARVQEVVDKESLEKEQNLWRQRMQSQCDADQVSLCILEHYRMRLAKLAGIKASL